VSLGSPADSDEIVKRTGRRDYNGLSATLAARMWHSVPAPDGQVSATNYWWRERFERWSAENDRERRREIGAPLAP
jgi:hypothetical protein